MLPYLHEIFFSNETMSIYRVYVQFSSREGRKKVHIRLWPTEYRLNFWCFMQICRHLSLFLFVPLRRDHFISISPFDVVSFFVSLLLSFARMSGWFITRKEKSQPRSFSYRIDSNECPKKKKKIYTKERLERKSIPNRTQNIFKHKTQDNLLTEKNDNKTATAATTTAPNSTQNETFLLFGACIF